MPLQKLSAISLAVILLHSTAYAQSPDGALKISVVQGQNEKNNIKLKLAVIPIVEVRDERDRLVSGVRVAFVLPNFGASGKFTDGTASMLVWTDSQGRAAASGLVPNTNEGKFNIRVTATYAGKEGSTTILMENTATDGPQKAPAALDAKKSNKMLWIILAAGGAAAAGGAVALMGGNKSTAPAPPTPTSITLGAVTVGGPR